MSRLMELKPGKHHITVTAADIECGTRGSADRCPIARAIKRTLGMEDIEVDGPRLSFDYGMEGICSGEDQINEFIQAFDEGRVVSPFEFDLALDYREDDGWEA